jgi:hypothetical protein
MTPWQTLVLLIIAGMFGLIGWLIGPKGRPGWRNLMTYGKVHPRSPLGALGLREAFTSAVAWNRRHGVVS